MVFVALPPQTLIFYRNPSSSPFLLAINLSSAIRIRKRRDIGATFRSNGSYWSSNSQEEKSLSHRTSIVLSSRIWLGKLDNCFKLLVSGIITFSTLFSLSPVADAVSDQAYSLTYQCEDVGSYYHDVDGLKGAALMKKLNSIVSPHLSLPYKEVWDALKFLDAADIDNPETSSEVIEIYSLRPVSKLLAGKPEGWNREHLWPRSYGLTDGPSLTDLHNIRPAGCQW
ncbi:uncharacterized protein LOC120111972 [Phoenix dactylifera]|uniref:Uncharacterized protein LOC120111972 n=1 Tax=Phoenix dactylifera TaxID=42345 RepID=A0A8B9AIC8_PHODC|nr:uncharacterized protein LOC120111972 [Phoenix dactylifera]